MKNAKKFSDLSKSTTLKIIGLILDDIVKYPKLFIAIGREAIL